MLVPDSTSGPELCRTGELIRTTRERNGEYLMTDAWRHAPHADDILDGLERAYESWQAKWNNSQSRQMIRAGVAEYEADRVFADYWVPLMKELEERGRG